MTPSEKLEARIDEVLAASFPASDPPPWTTGVDERWGQGSGVIDEADHVRGRGQPGSPR